MKKFIIAGIVVILALGGYFAFQQYQKAQAARQGSFETVKAQRGNLTATVGATGTVHANQSAVLSWQTTGIIQKVNFQEGDLVHPDQVIASLDPTSLPQNIILAQADLVNAKRSLDNLTTSQTAQAQAQLTLTQAQDAYDKAKNHREGMKYPRASQTNIDNAWSNYQLALSSAATAEDAWDKVKALPVDNLLRLQVLSQLTSAQMKRDQALANYNWLTGKATPADLAEADSQLAVAKAKLEDAQREWDRLKHGPDPSDIAAAQAHVDAILATTNLTRLTAPFTGTITDLHMKPGDVIGAASLSAAGAASPNQSIRIEDLSHLLVDVPVTEVDINRVTEGQLVTMSFDAILGKLYNGKVVQVAKTGATTQGVVNYMVTVEITDHDDSVLPGMTAAVNVVVTQLKDVLQVPNRAIRLRDGQRIVYLLRNGSPVSIQVKLGATSETNSQVISGDIKAGDDIILNPPLDTNPGPGFMRGG
ncbi:MAG: efflux RND transporter periplasmic adaptor subunit [Anaerolineaceae bacterium]|nr:efflux RND transporter periplasmic adaptor subunit [Anaerolineaceae bacterium]